jgi:hypothetical protein
VKSWKDARCSSTDRVGSPLYLGKELQVIFREVMNMYMKIQWEKYGSDPRV